MKEYIKVTEGAVALEQATLSPISMDTSRPFIEMVCKARTNNAPDIMQRCRAAWKAEGSVWIDDGRYILNEVIAIHTLNAHDGDIIMMRVKEQ